MKTHKQNTWLSEQTHAMNQHVADGRVSNNYHQPTPEAK